jgi:hypothetical protein
MLNRAALIVRPAEPYLAWARALDPELVPDPADEQTVYLVRELDEATEADDILEEVYEAVFEEELAGWCEDESLWPSPRTLDVFREWFTIELHSMILDLGDDELVDDED